MWILSKIFQKQAAKQMAVQLATTLKIAQNHKITKFLALEISDFDYCYKTLQNLKNTVRIFRFTD